MLVSSIGDLRIEGQVKQIVPIEIKGITNYLVVRNNQSVLVLSGSDQSKVLAQK
jgi:hypothetical protein